jgi:hypothetical protein
VRLILTPEERQPDDDEPADTFPEAGGVLDGEDRAERVANQAQGLAPVARRFERVHEGGEVIVYRVGEA